MAVPPRDRKAALQSLVKPDVVARSASDPESSVQPKRLLHGEPAGLFGGALDGLDDALAVFDARDRLVCCNDVYRDWHGGASASTLVALRFDQLLDTWLTRLQFASHDERARFREQRLLRREGRGAALEARTLNGRHLRVSDRRAADGKLVTTIIDRTEDERLLEEERAARRAAEDISTAKSDFLYSMIHELRTPLNAILGFGQLLQRDTKLPLPERHRTRVDQILKGGAHLVHLIDDLLDLSSIEAGRTTLSPEPVDVLAVLEQLQALLGAAANTAGVRLLLVRPDEATIPRIAADPTRLTQILMNFGSNAIKYNRPDGSVCFRVSMPRPGRVRISVADTGLGIPADQQAKLFQPFQRAGQEQSTIPGTGLGLAISKPLAGLMQGAIGFHSAAGTGSEFWLDLPVAAT